MSRCQGVARVLVLCCLLLCTAVGAVQAGEGLFPDLLDATLDELRRGLDAGHFTSVDLTRAYLARIGEVNAQLHAVNQVNPDALAIAAELDRARARGAGGGPLHGIPVLVKDNIATGDRMSNTAGSFALVGAKVREDSTVAAKLRRAGVVILGKANLSQWANWRSANGSSGWSAVGGQAVGAYFPGQDPSGSSSGSAVASSIGLAWASLGTETDGSIIMPSDSNNLVGIKPTVGLTSRYLVVPVSEHQDSVGPLARTVKDAAHLLNAIVGRDGRDRYTADVPFDEAPDYVAACRETGLRGRRIGIPRRLVEDEALDAAVQARYDEAIRLLRCGGATIVDDVEVGHRNLTGELEKLILTADFNTGVARYFGQLAANPHGIASVRDLQAFAQGDPREDYPERDTKTWQQGIDLGYGNDSPAFAKAYRQQLRMGNGAGFPGVLRNRSLDALFVPTGLGAGLAAPLGCPAVVVPMGRMPDDTAVERNGFGNLNATGPNQPFGMAFVGARFGEEALIGMAYALEQMTQVRRTVRPRVVPRTGLDDVVERSWEANGI